jgi:ATP-binding cassette subfamily B protein
MSMHGVNNEEKSDLNKAESKSIRQRSLRLLTELVRPLRVRIGVGLAAVTVATLMRVLGPALIAIGIDTALPAALKNNWAQLWAVAGGYIGAATIAAGGMAFFISYAAVTNQNLIYELRQRLFRHSQRLSIDFHEKYTSGRFISRQTNDLNSIRELLDTGGNEMVAGVLTMVFTAIAIYALDPIAFWVMMVAMIPQYFLAAWFARNTRKAYRISSVASARLIVHFVETMTGIRAVKAFRKERANQAKYDDLVEDYRAINARTILLFGIYHPSEILIGDFAVVAVLIFGGFRVLDGGLGIGVLTATVLYARRFFDPMESIAMFYNAYQSASSALEKISGVLEEEPSVVEPKHPAKLENPKGHLAFNDVEFHYSNGKTVLPPFNLDIPAGQTIAMVGTTGAGKSTLAKLISRFYDPTHGTVTLDGIDLRQIADTDLRRAVVMVTQEAYLFGGTVASNIELGKPGATSEEIEAAAKAVGAHDFIMELPDGYNTDVNKRGGRVSAGQRQLISFARAFLASPAVLLLDEATASLDIPSERLVQQGLQTLLAGRTAIIIAHRLSTVSIADRVLVLEHGKIIEDGSPAELIAGTGKFAKMHKAWRDSLV